jgi:putative ABC transport system permease protein
VKAVFRTLAAHPVYAIVVVATLAIGFGANAAIFALTRTVLLRPVPYPDAARLVQVVEVNPTSGVELSGVVPANYLELRRGRPHSDGQRRVMQFRRIFSR